MSENFRTKIVLKKSMFNVTYSDNIMLMGSCFSDNIGDKLSSHKFSTNINPFGIVFNPISLAKQLKLLSCDTFNFDEYVFSYNNLWHSWQHHSSFSAESKQELLNNIEIAWQNGNTFLKKTNYLIITLGTAYAYKLNEGNFYVSNCHQFPNKNFTKQLFSANEIVAKLGNSIEQIKFKNPDFKIIFTISPVRHWKDGVVENQRSKANLITAVHEICDNLDFCTYFPSYELVMDDLRDYRFYKADMLHPNQQAVNYIWQQFKVVYFDNHTSRFLNDIEKLYLNKLHRPRFPQSEQHLAFLAKLQVEETIIDKKIEVIKNRKK